MRVNTAQARRLARKDFIKTGPNAFPSSQTFVDPTLE